MIDKSLLVIGAEKKGPSTKKIIEEGEKLFKEVYFAPVKEITLKLGEKEIEIKHKTKDLTKFDYCLPRIDSKRAQHGYHIIRAMDIMGMKKPYPAETIHIAHNKFTTLEVLQKVGIPVPETYLVGSEDVAKDVFKKTGFPLVIKIVDSFGGQGVILVENQSSAFSVISTLNFMKQQIIIQEFVENPGEDTRAYIIDGEIIAGYKRIASKDEFRSNLFSGGRAEYTTITGEMAEVALKAATVVKSDIIAIDMLTSEEGPKVIEVNLNPGLKGIQPFKNVAKIIVDFIAEKVGE